MEEKNEKEIKQRYKAYVNSLISKTHKDLGLGIEALKGLTKRVQNATGDETEGDAAEEAIFCMIGAIATFFMFMMPSDFKKLWLEGIDLDPLEMAEEEAGKWKGDVAK